MSDAWIQTYTGKQFWPLSPQQEDVCIFDIAHALSNLCRFSGHVKSFYSVAQHSVLVAQALPEHLRLEGLLHDASEAYCVDVPRPIKHSEGMAEYRNVEAYLQMVILNRFGLLWPNHHLVKTADDALLMTERRDLMSLPPKAWSTEHQQPLADRIIPWTPAYAEQKFLGEFWNYYTGADRITMMRQELARRDGWKYECASPV